VRWSAGHSKLTVEYKVDETVVSVIPAGTGHREIRRNNLEVVLRHLSLVGPDSRASIAARAGLTRSTISRLVGELLDLGLVSETGAAKAQGIGRPATLLELDGRHVLAVGAEVNVDYLAVLVTDLAGREVYEQRRAYDAIAEGPAHSITALAGLGREALGALAGLRGGRRPIVAGLTVAVPGLVDAPSGVVTLAPNRRWSGVPVADRLRELLRLGPAPVSVGNDASLAAVAEYRVGSHAGTPDLIYITGEMGIGGGIIVAGRALRGVRGFGGEVGHMKLDPGGPVCGCGRRGCWEALIGLHALLQAAFPGGPGQHGVAAGEPPEAKAAAVARLARAGDAHVLTALADIGRWVGIGAANLANVFNPRAIVLGGYFTLLADWILPPAARALAEGVLAPDAGGCSLTTSSLGFSAAARGGAIHVADQIISDPAMLDSRRGLPAIRPSAPAAG
jgi:predicted NBD/HSP70 family sugar kinase